jgi:hypothetical protein
VKETEGNGYRERDRGEGNRGEREEGGGERGREEGELEGGLCVFVVRGCVCVCVLCVRERERKPGA